MVCFFARKVYDEETISRALSTVGFEWSADDLARLGARVLREKYDFKFREGFELEGIRIPGRILETPAPAGDFDEQFLRRAITSYREQILG